MREPMPRWCFLLHPTEIAPADNRGPIGHGYICFLRDNRQEEEGYLTGASIGADPQSALAAAIQRAANIEAKEASAP